MKIIIDRIENGIIVAELPDGQPVNIPSILLPEAAESDIYTIEKDISEAENRRKRIGEKMDRLFKD